MDKVNEFEHGIDNPTPIQTKEDLERANEVYRLPETPTDYREFLKLVADHKLNQVPRLERLNRYYVGQNDGIMQRGGRMNQDKADYRTAHPFAENITTFRTSYLVGQPVKTELSEDQVQANEWLEDWNNMQDVDAHNLDLLTDMSKFGRAYELLHRGDDDQTHISISNPEWTFVVYDESVQQSPLFAVRYPSVWRNQTEYIKIEVYLEDRVLKFPPTTLHGGELLAPEEEYHEFGGVPVVEYGANRFRIGDYEKVLSMIDLYDFAQSDTGNYMTDTNEAMLVVSGDFDAEGVVYNKDANMMLLPTGMTPDGRQTTLKAEYIYPQYDVTGVEAYKDRLRKDIYLFSYTPDVSDDNFAGTQSGEAMKYKLIGLEQDRAIKERLIRRGFSQRYALLANISRVVRELSEDVDMNTLRVTFTPNLPANLSQELPTLVNAGAKFSQETLLALASFVDNVQEEIERVDREQEEAQERMMVQFGKPDEEKEELDGEGDDEE